MGSLAGGGEKYSSLAEARLVSGCKLGDGGVRSCLASARSWVLGPSG